MENFSVLIELLKDRDTFLVEIRDKVNLERKILSLLIASSLGFCAYGLIIGASQSGLQALASGIKLPSLYLVTLLICLPTLFFFHVLAGSRMTFSQYLLMALSAVSVISVLMVGFAPVTLFFLITVNDYLFFVLLNVIIFAIAGFVGVHFLYKGMRFLTREDISGSGLRTKILPLWLSLYGFVGSQMGWVLRPFFGTPEQPFALFREREGNFYLSILHSIGNLLGWY
ncbi:actin-binding WH2 domain-containing protein [Oscillatoriales cyanobacterium LEGE 11467]|uniref:Actin-binding WH2 domain-containing protein n=1 Tax=Zarconia navalis LEGE 11467 TaxID=1828826 RepID=A0A928VW92_9CYAN|nr:actin-binding WH2 domain-containing protein [Zarconia navalis]MBE9039298.1 actin-binding WH2 domain-containing protein [Zarconia navalis LEGE 11467]